MSTITVYGATGMVGQQIAEEAVRRGHHVHGVARHAPERPLDRVDYELGDLSDTAQLVARAAGSDVVVIAVPPDRSGGSHEPLLEAHRDLVAAAPKARLFVVGGAGSLLTDDGTRLVDTPDFPEAYKAEATTFAKVLELYRAAGDTIDWVMACPAPEIGPGEATEKYVIGGDSPAGDFVSTGTFAVAALDEIEEPTVKNGRFTVANA